MSGQRATRFALQPGARCRAARQRNMGAAQSTPPSRAELLATLEPSDEDRVLALTHGLVHVSSETSGSPPRIALEPLDTDEHSLSRLKEWFRYFVEVRNADGAERALQTAIANGATPTQACDMMVAAATDHF